MRPPQRVSTLRRLERVLLAGLAAATACAALGGVGWPFELFSHFEPQLAIVWVLFAVAFLVARRRLAALGSLALAALLLWPWPGLRGADALARHCNGPTLDLVTANVWYRNDDTAPLLDWLQARGADVVVLQELTPAWAQALDALPEWPHARLRAREDAYGLGLLLRSAALSIDDIDLAGDGHLSFAARVLVDGQPIEILALHARWPMTPAMFESRNTALEAVARRARAAEVPVVIIGDLNLTPSSPYFTRLLAASGLVDAQAGRGWRPTWHANLWPIALRIDHVLVSDSLCVEEVELGPPIGSDHRPLRVRLRLALDEGSGDGQ